MIVFPLKWLPWILVIAGFIGFVTTGDPYSFISLLIGGVWLYLKHKGNKGGTSTKSAPQSTSSSTAAYKAPVQTTTIESNTVNEVAVSVCPTCSTPVDEEMFFCTKCGTKVR